MKCQRRIQWPLPGANAVGQLSDRCLQWRYPFPQRSVRPSFSRRTTGSSCQKVMESYQSWFGEGPELSVLRMLGLFDRPADEKALGVFLKSPAIPGLTESLMDLSPSEWRTILARLRRARLLTGEDPHNPGHLDTHPLIREYFGEQLGVNESRLGRNATGGSITIIERLRHSCRITLAGWSHFS